MIVQSCETVPCHSLAYKLMLNDLARSREPGERPNYFGHRRFPAHTHEAARALLSAVQAFEWYIVFRWSERACVAAHAALKAGPVRSSRCRAALAKKVVAEAGDQSFFMQH